MLNPDARCATLTHPELIWLQARLAGPRPQSDQISWMPTEMRPGRPERSRRDGTDLRRAFVVGGGRLWGAALNGRRGGAVLGRGHLEFQVTLCVSLLKRSEYIRRILASRNQ